MFPICPQCEMGRLHPVRATFVRVYRGTLTQAPNTPGWRCDSCHAMLFDQAAVGRIELLIGDAGPPPNRHQSRHTNDLTHAPEMARGDLRSRAE